MCLQIRLDPLNLIQVLYFVHICQSFKLEGVGAQVITL
jgi:hypothetical protein